MTGARDHVLAEIRAGLGRGPLADERAAELRRRLGAPRPNLIPRRADLPHPQRVDLFAAEAARNDASVARVAGLDQVAEAVESYLAENGLPKVLKVAPDPALRDIPWSARGDLTAVEGGGDPSDPVGVAHAFAGVAETGTLVMVCGPDNPATLNFLPDTHVVVVRDSQIVGSYEEAWQRLRDQSGGDFMPRTVTWITGPSRTADIEQTILLGAHGPRNLLIVVAGES